MPGALIFLGVSVLEEQQSPRIAFLVWTFALGSMVQPGAVMRFMHMVERFTQRLLTYLNATELNEVCAGQWPKAAKPMFTTGL